MDKKLTKIQAFNAMACLLDIYYWKTQSDDLGGLLGSMSFLSDGTTTDEALWEVWVECLNSVLQFKKIQDTELIDILYVFLAIKPFLEYFFEEQHYSEDIVFFLKNIKNLHENKNIDQMLWNNWIKCVDEVLIMQDSRDYLKLF